MVVVMWKLSVSSLDMRKVYKDLREGICLAKTLLTDFTDVKGFNWKGKSAKKMYTYLTNELWIFISPQLIAMLGLLFIGKIFSRVPILKVLMLP